MSKGPVPDPPQEPVRLPDGFRGKHPGYSAYQLYGCRCAGCQELMRAAARRSYAARSGRLRPEPPVILTVRHKGTLSRYNRGCRCGRCCLARANYDRRRWWAKRYPDIPYAEPED